jgi:DNA-binding SARP family transcriptional activator/tetratricopeptide (TPR) repeat protein
VLGRIGVTTPAGLQTVPRAQARGLFALLLLHPYRLMSREVLTEALWGGTAPATSRQQIQASVYAIRRLLAAAGRPEAVVGSTFGYELRVAPDAVDAAVFEQHVRQARDAATAGDASRAADLLRAGLAQWRGEPLSDAAGAFVEATRARLSERWLAATEELADLELGLGRHAALADELATVVDAHPLREGLRIRHMTALYRADRPIEALETFRTYRRQLADREGLDPGPEIAALALTILRRDPQLSVRREVTVSTGPPPAPAVTPPPPVPAQLPADVDAFIGRTVHLRLLDDLLMSGAEPATAVRIAALSGAGGVGKTALAIRWAHRARPHFPDGQVYVNLCGYATSPPLRPIEALDRLLLALGVPPEGVPADEQSAAGLYRTVLADRRVLVVLDNAQSADQVRPLLPGGPSCAVLVTSRDAMPGLVAREGARQVVVDVLPADDAVGLLTRLLGAARVTAEPAATARLAELCAGLPLAIRIAAANLTGRGHRRITDYVAELERGDRLAALAVHGDPGSAVAAAFDLSYRGLPDDAQRLFRLLGLAPGPDIALVSAAALAGVVVSDAAALLDWLAGAHLVDEHQPRRYSLHDLLRLYAAERADGEDSPDARRAAIGRLCAYYLSTADAAAKLLYPGKMRLPMPAADPGLPVTAFDDRVTALAWMNAERTNLVATVAHVADHGPRNFAWLIADVMRGYFHVRMHTIEWLATARAGLAAAEAEADLRAQTAARLSLGLLHWRQGRYRPAVAQHTYALRFARRLGWFEGESAAQGNLGAVCAETGQMSAAAEHITQAIALNRRMGRLSGEAVAVGNLGMVYLYLGRLADADELYVRAMGLYREIGSRDGEALILGNLGEVRHALGRSAEARQHLEAALSAHREAGDLPCEADVLRCLATVHGDAGRYEEALHLAQTAQELARETGRRRLANEILNTLGTIQLRLGRPDEAIELHREALQDTLEGYPRTDALLGMAAAQRSAGARAAAFMLAQQALALARRGGYRVLEGNAWAVIASTHLDGKDGDRALRCGTKAAEIQRETGYRLGEASAHAVLADACHATGDLVAASEHAATAAAIVADLGVPQ